MIGFDNIVYTTSLAFSLGGVGYAIALLHLVIDLKLSRRGVGGIGGSAVCYPLILKPKRAWYPDFLE